MDKDGVDRGNPQKKLIGWKAIGRHLGKSQRATQLWEIERGLPIHRIPGGRSPSVFAYVDEVDLWMRGKPPGVEGEHHAPSAVEASLVSSLDVAASERTIRPPGILVLPFEHRCDLEPGGACDALGQQLVERLSAIQPVRVLSWMTSRTVRQGIDSLDMIASRLHVRYLVEGSIERDGDDILVDARVVDAELDQIMLADRFVAHGQPLAVVWSQVAQCMALHFALIHEGALVEPMCLAGVTPSGFLDYLEGARFFFEDPGGTSGRSLVALERALARDPAFVPARTLRGLALLGAAGSERDVALMAEVRSIVTDCRAETSARVTTAFLHAAIERIRRCPDATRGPPSLQALRWIPPLIASEGRLYERRSPLRSRTKDEARPIASPSPDRRDGDPCKPRGQRLFDEWLQTIVASHRRADEQRIRLETSGIAASVRLSGM